jgi:2-isopropylmalate synthase
MKSEHHLDLPRRLQIEFSGVVQRHTDVGGGEVSPAQLWEIFTDEYLPNPVAPWGRLALNGIRQTSEGDGADHVDHLQVEILDGGEVVQLEGHGNGPIAAFVDALGQRGIDVRVLDYAEHAMSAGGDATAAAYVECAVGERVLWGVGMSSNIVRASLRAVISAVNRAHGRPE